METLRTNSAAETNPVEIALARATLYSALALGFRPPQEEAIARLVKPQEAAALEDAAALLDADRNGRLVFLVEAVAEAGGAGAAVLNSFYRSLFGHTVRGTVPPYETEYGNEALFQQPQELADLVGFYHAFGLAVKSGEHERPDHISCECEFLTFLAMKEAYALEHQETEMLEQTRNAQLLFLKDHLGRFLPSFAARLARENPCGFYGALAELCLRFVSQESVRLGVPLGGVNLALRPADDDRVPMACGSGTECAAMPGACLPEGADSV